LGAAENVAIVYWRRANARPQRKISGDRSALRYDGADYNNRSRITFMNTLQLILLLLGASVLAVVLFRRINLPPVLGYLLVGSLIGPHAFNFMKDVSDAQHLAEFGVVFLMFSIGLEFSLPKLYAMKRIVFGLGLMQVALTMFAFAGLSILSGHSWQLG
jgi:CPA2 family monovalent cation:H+ antiporter-2